MDSSALGGEAHCAGLHVTPRTLPGKPLRRRAGCTERGRLSLVRGQGSRVGPVSPRRPSCVVGGSRAPGGIRVGEVLSNRRRERGRGLFMS